MMVPKVPCALLKLETSSNGVFPIKSVKCFAICAIILLVDDYGTKVQMIDCIGNTGNKVYCIPILRYAILDVIFNGIDDSFFNCVHN